MRGVVSSWQPGQLLFAGFEGTAPPEGLRSLIQQGRIGGVILFTRNLRDPHQVCGLVRGLLEAAPPEAPITVSIDQEGGRVQRLKAPWTEWPPMRRVAEAKSVELTEQVGAALALEVAEVGIGLNFAPVMDVHTNPRNPIIGDRSFASTPKDVAEHGCALIRGLQGHGIAACAKHFPGHGDTSRDSHLELPTVSHDLDRLRAVELPPFIAAAQEGVASMMTAHILFPALDPKRPATVSPEVMAILRDEIGYDGLVFSDDLEMKAVADRFRPDQLVRGALESRVDALLVCRHFDLVAEVLQHLERAPDTLLEPAIERVRAFKRRFPPRFFDVQQPPTRPPYPEHQALRDRLDPT